MTVPDIIAVAKICQYLSTKDVANGSLFGARISPQTPIVLKVESAAVEWMYDHDPANSTLTSTANYLYSLCRGYNLKAQKILGTAGGSVSPINIQSAPTPLQFTVDGSTEIPTGGSSATLTQFIGYNLLFVRNQVPQSTVDLGDSTSYYSWSRSIGLFTVSPAAAAGELFQIYPI